MCDAWRSLGLRVGCFELAFSHPCDAQAATGMTVSDAEEVMTAYKDIQVRIMRRIGACKRLGVIWAWRDGKNLHQHPRHRWITRFKGAPAIQEAPFHSLALVLALCVWILEPAASSGTNRRCLAQPVQCPC